MDENENTKLKEFLLDIDCLKDLDKWTSKVNIFEVLKITNTEIRHSNVLAWLLDANASHELSDKILKEFVTHILKNNKFDIDVIRALLMDFESFSVFRELNNIDILLVSNKEKFIICIENKIWSKERNNQLNKYEKIVNEQYKDFYNLFVFLTPDGYETENNDNWIAFNYVDIIGIIENAIKNVEMKTEVKLIINNYIEAVRRHIVGDTELTKICDEIYKKHRDALDLIYENKSDNLLQISNYIIGYLKTNQEIHINDKKSGKTFIRFTTNLIEKHIPNEPLKTQRGWGTGDTFFYEIVNREDSIKFQCALANVNTEKATKLFNICKKDNDKLKENWQWKVVQYWTIIDKKDKNNSDFEELKEKFKGKFNDIFYKEIKSFEEKIEKNW